MLQVVSILLITEILLNIMEGGKNDGLKLHWLQPKYIIPDNSYVSELLCLSGRVKKKREKKLIFNNFFRSEHENRTPATSLQEALPVLL